LSFILTIPLFGFQSTVVFEPARRGARQLCDGGIQGPALGALAIQTALPKQGIVTLPSSFVSEGQLRSAVKHNGGTLAAARQNCARDRQLARQNGMICRKNGHYSCYDRTNNWK